jgi:hypothetical protein
MEEQKKMIMMEKKEAGSLYVQVGGRETRWSTERMLRRTNGKMPRMRRERMARSNDALVDESQPYILKSGP